jgi:hypothetical protein
VCTDFNTLLPFLREALASEYAGNAKVAKCRRRVAARHTRSPKTLSRAIKALRAERDGVPVPLAPDVAVVGTNATDPTTTPVPAAPIAPAAPAAPVLPPSSAEVAQQIASLIAQRRRVLHELHKCDSRVARSTRRQLHELRARCDVKYIDMMQARKFRKTDHNTSEEGKNNFEKEMILALRDAEEESAGEKKGAPAAKNSKTTKASSKK